MIDDLKKEDLSDKAKELIRIAEIENSIQDELILAETKIIKDEGSFLVSSISYLEGFDDIPYHLVDELEDRLRLLRERKAAVAGGKISTYDTEAIDNEAKYLHNCLASPLLHDETFEKLDSEKLSPVNAKIYKEIIDYRDSNSLGNLPDFEKLLAFCVDPEIREVVQELRTDINLRLSRLDNEDCLKLINKAHSFRILREGMKTSILGMKKGLSEDKVLELYENTAIAYEETLVSYEDNDPSMAGVSPRNAEEAEERFVAATLSSSMNNWLNWTDSMLAVILANTNVGKSTFLLNIIVDIYLSGGYAPLFLTEMDKELVHDKIWGMLSGVPIDHIEHGTMTLNEELAVVEVICEQYTDATDVLAVYKKSRDYVEFQDSILECSLKEHNRIEIFQKGKQFKTIPAMVNLIKKLKKKHGNHMDLVAYDYISTSNISGDKSPWEKFIQHTAYLEDLSKDLSLFVLSAAQAYDNHKPKYGESLKDSCGFIGGLSIIPGQKYRLQIMKTRRRNKLHAMDIDFDLPSERIDFTECLDLGAIDIPEIEKPKSKSKAKKVYTKIGDDI